MYCYIHPENNAIGTCINCGKAVCKECAIDIDGQIHCEQCVKSQQVVSKSGSQTPPAPTNSIAVVSLVLGILGLLGCLCGGAIGGILFGAPAAITGWIARKQILETSSEQQGIQLATIGLVLGIVEVVIGLILFFIFGAALGAGFINELMSY